CKIRVLHFQLLIWTHWHQYNLYRYPILSRDYGYCLLLLLIFSSFEQLMRRHRRRMLPGIANRTNPGWDTARSDQYSYWELLRLWLSETFPGDCFHSSELPRTGPKNFHQVEQNS